AEHAHERLSARDRGRPAEHDRRRIIAGARIARGRHGIRDRLAGAEPAVKVDPDDVRLFRLLVIGADDHDVGSPWTLKTLGLIGTRNTMLGANPSAPPKAAPPVS